MKNNLKRLMSVMLAVMIMCSLFSINASAATTYKVTAKNSSSYYLIKNLSSGKCLNIAGLTSKKKTSETNVNVFAYEKGSGDQLWKFTSTSKGFVLTPKANTNLCLNPHSNTPKSGTNVNVYTKISGDKTQAWKIEYVSKYKAYIFRSAYNNKLVLTAAGNGDEANVKLATYKSGDKKQLWTCSGLKVTEVTSSSNSTTTTKPAIRTTAPSTSSNYYRGFTSAYTPVAYGGTMQDVGNCTWYCAGRVYEYHGIKLSTIIGPTRWWNEHGTKYSRGKTPKVGAVMVWQGHVAFVEKIDSNGHVWVSESSATVNGIQGVKFRYIDRTKYPISGFLGYVYFN